MKLNDALRYLLYVGIFAVPFLVFPVFDGFFFPFITSKAFLFRIIVEVMLVAWVVLALREPEYRPKISGILLAILAFVLAITLASAFGEDFSQSFWSNYERMMGVIAYLHFFAFFLIIGSVLKTREMWHKFFGVSLAVSFIVGLQGFGEMPDASRISAALGNPIYLAAYALIHVFLAGFLFENARRHFKRPELLWFYGIAGVFNVFVLYFTGTRGTLLGLLGGIFLTSVLIALFETKRKTLRKTAIGISVFFLLVPVLFFTVKDTPFVQNNATLSRFANISLEEGTGGARINLWEMSWDGFKERPVFGYGLENFDIVFAKYYQSELYAEEAWFDRAHSVVFNWLVVSGFVGLLSYLLVFAVFLFSLWRLDLVRRAVSKIFPSQDAKSKGIFAKIKEKFTHEGSGEFSLVEKSILTGLAASYFVHGLFVFEDTVSFILFFAVLAFAHYSVTENRPHLFGKQTAGDSTTATFATVLGVAMLFVIYFANYLPMRENIVLSDALQTRNAKVKLKHFQRALSYDTFGDMEAREQLILTTRNFDPANISPETLQGYYTLGKEAVEESALQRPNDPRPQFFKTLLHLSYNEPELAIKSANKLLELSPNKPQFLGIKIRILLDLERYEEARKIAKHNYELEKRNQEAVDLYAQALIFNGEKETAKKVLKEAYGVEDVANPEIINAYAEVKDFEELVVLWKEKVKRNPEDAKARLSLVYAYYKNGQNQEAIAELGELKKMKPEMAEQIDKYIANIRAGRDPGA